MRDSLRAAKLRSGPGVYYAIVERLESGARLTVVQDGPKWVKVRTGAGREGWVSARAFTPRPPPKGYGALAGEKGLSGVSTTVATMATRGLRSPAGAVDAVLDGLLAEAPFRPEELDAFLAGFDARPVCARLPGWPRELGLQLGGDPESDEFERDLGLAVASRLLAKDRLRTARGLDRYVNQVGAAVAAASSRYDLAWRFLVVHDERPRLISLPGGLVLLSDGLLAGLRDEAELAGVLGHAVAHLALGHGAERLRSLVRDAGSDWPARAAEAADGPYPAVEERAADSLATAYTACAGYDASGLRRALERGLTFEARGGDSPPVRSRLARLRRLERALQGAGQVRAERYQAVLESPAGR